MCSKIKCIISEDYEALNEIYYNLLNRENDIEVVGRARSGNEVIQLLKTVDTDVILMDIEMRGLLDGVETCKKITEGNAEIKVIMLTCHEDEEIVLSAFGAGAIDYVLKTSPMLTILEAIRSAYNNTTSLSAYITKVITKHLRGASQSNVNFLEIMAVISSLTASELDILSCLINGMKQKAIAMTRNVEIVTIKAHTSRLHKKFNCKYTADIVKIVKNANLESFIERLRTIK